MQAKDLRVHAQGYSAAVPMDSAALLMDPPTAPAIWERINDEQ